MAALTTDYLLAKIANLSPDKQQSVLDFVEFLQRQPSPLASSISPPPNFTSNDFDDW
jgi:Protein of unknown function (DUF2281)